MLVGIGYLVFSDQSNDPNRPVATETLPPKVYQAPGIIWNNTGRNGSAPFEIITKTGADYYIKLVDYNSGTERMGIFVKGGQPLEVEVPPGSYKIRYAYGEAWRGFPTLFGPGRHTSYQQSSARFDFSTYGGYTVELIRQSGGNMPTRRIDAGQF